MTGIIYSSNSDVFKEGFIVSLGQNMFSLPKLLWFSLRSCGLFYSTRSRVDAQSRCSESVIEFGTMFVRVEMLEDEHPKLAYRNDKVSMYCLRVGDKRKCRLLCFTSWEERDFWVIAILTAIAQFKISNVQEAQTDLCGKIRYGSMSSTMRGTHTGKTASTSSARLARGSLRRSFRKKFNSLRSRKSVRDSRDGGEFGENVYFTSSSSDVFSDTNSDCCKTVGKTKEKDANSKRVYDVYADGNVPPNTRCKPWLFERLTSTVDSGKKRKHFPSFITKFTERA